MDHHRTPTGDKLLVFAMHPDCSRPMLHNEIDAMIKKNHLSITNRQLQQM